MGATALLDDAAELLELALGAEERAETLLGQLARLLVLQPIVLVYLYDIRIADWHAPWSSSTTP